MTVSLGGIALSDELILDGIETATEVVITQRRTLAGVSNLTADPAPGGRQLQLQGDNHWDLAQVDAIRALRALMQPVQLVHHRGTFDVLIGAIDVDPSISYSNPDDTTWYTGTVTMIEV